MLLSVLLCRADPVRLMQTYWHLQATDIALYRFAACAAWAELE